MLGLTGGEWFVVAFVTITVVSSRFWPLLGGRLAVRLSGPRSDDAPKAPRE